MKLKDIDNEKDIEIVTLPDNKLKIFLPPSTLGPADLGIIRTPNLIVNGKSNQDQDRGNFMFTSKLEYLGTGGFSKVYKYRGDLEKKAVKKIIADPKYYSKKLTAEDSLKREIFGMTKIDCDNSLKVYGVFQNNAKDNYYILMELCDGNVEKYIKDRGSPLNIYETLILLFQLNKAFYLLDVHNIIHRDIKPSNILYKEDKDIPENNKITDKKLFDGKKLIFKLGDYGVCLPLYNQSFSKSQFMGTLDFMAPEIYEMKCEKEHPIYTKKIDLFSLGQTILCLMGFIEKASTLTKNSVEKLRKNCPLFNGNTKEKLLADLVFNYLLVFDVEKRADWQTYFNHPLFEDDHIYNRYENKNHSRGNTVKIEKRSKKRNSMDSPINDIPKINRKTNHSRDHKNKNNTYVSRKRSKFNIGKINNDIMNKSNYINIDNKNENNYSNTNRMNNNSIKEYNDKIFVDKKNKRVHSISNVNMIENNNDKKANNINNMNKLVMNRSIGRIIPIINNKNNDMNENNNDKKVNDINKTKKLIMNRSFGRITLNTNDKNNDDINKNKNNNNNEKIKIENNDKNIFSIKERYDKLNKEKMSKINNKENNEIIYDKVYIKTDYNNNSMYDKDDNIRYNSNNNNNNNNNSNNNNNNNKRFYETYYTANYNRYKNNENKEKINNTEKNKSITRKILNFSTEEEKVKNIPNFPITSNMKKKENLIRVSIPFDSNDYNAEKKLTYFNPKVRNFFSNKKENNEKDNIEVDYNNKYNQKYYNDSTYKEKNPIINQKIRNIYINNKYNNYANKFNYIYSHNHNQNVDKNLYNNNNEINVDKNKFERNVNDQSNNAYYMNNNNNRPNAVYESAQKPNNNNIDYNNNVGGHVGYYSVRNRYKMLKKKMFTNSDKPVTRTNLDSENQEKSIKIINKCNVCQNLVTNFPIFDPQKTVYGFKHNNDLYNNLENDINNPQEDIGNKYTYNIQIINNINNNNCNDRYLNIGTNNMNKLNTSYVATAEIDLNSNEKNNLKNRSYQKYFYNLDNNVRVTKNIFNIRVVNNQVEQNYKNKMNGNNAFYFSKYSRVNNNY